MCECKTKLEGQLTERFRANAPSNECNHATEIIDYTFVMVGNSFTHTPKLDVHVVYDRTNKQGVSVRKTFKTHMLASYCPFCGEKLKRECDE